MRLEPGFLGAPQARPRERSGDHGVPASERAGGSAGAKPPGLVKFLLAVWIAWATLVVTRVHVQLWRLAADEGPAAVGALVWRALRATGICTAVAVAVAVLAGAAHVAGRSVRRRLGDRSGAVLMIAAGVAAPVWFAGADTLAARQALLHTGFVAHAGEAFGRAFVGLVGAAFVAGAGFALGGMILGLAGVVSASRTERLVLAPTLGLGALAYLSLACAGAGVYRPPTVAALVAIILIGGGIRAWMRPPCANAAPVAPAFDLASWRPQRFEIPWLVLGAVAVSFALVAALAPETEYDALWYHLYLPQRWLEGGHPVDLVEEYVSLYPLTWELVFGAGLVFGGVVAAKLLHFICLPLLAVCVALVAGRDPRSTPAGVAVGLLLTAPTVLWEAGTAYVDLALALYAASGVYALARFIESRERSWQIVAAIELGFGAATKHLGLVVLAIAIAGFMAAAWSRRRSVRALALDAAVIAGVALVLPVPWYVRSWQASGNPFFPELYAVFGGGPPDRWDALTEHGLMMFKAHFGRGHGLLDVMRLPWDVTVHAASFGGSLGALFLLLSPAVLFGGWPSRATSVLGAGAVAYAAVWASPISSLQLRFLMPVVSVLAILGAQGWQHLTAAGVRIRGATPVIAAALLLVGVLQLPPFVVIQEADRAGWTGQLTHVLRGAPAAVVLGRESSEAYLAREVPSYAAWQYVNARLPWSARVLTFSGGDQLYSRRRRVPHDTVLARAAVWNPADSDIETVGSALKRLQVTHILYDARAFRREPLARLAIASPRFRHACVVEHADGRFILCRVDYEQLGAVSRTAQTAHAR